MNVGRSFVLLKAELLNTTNVFVRKGDGGFIFPLHAATTNSWPLKMWNLRSTSTKASANVRSNERHTMV
jgi:hypothetical protein